MQRASKLFSEADHRRVAEAVANAEARTSAEIVPVVATASGRYDRAEDMVGLWFGLVALSVGWWLAQGVELSDWGVPAPQAGAAVGLGIGARRLAGGRVPGPPVQWPASAVHSEERAEGGSGARRPGGLLRPPRASHRGGSGLLVYVSLLEHMAVVLADAQVLEKLGQQKVDALCASLVSELRKGAHTDALCHTIEQAGLALAEALPSQAQNRNELPDALVVLD